MKQIYVQSWKKTRLLCWILLWISSKLTIKIAERRHWHFSGVFIAKFKHFTPFSSVYITSDFEQAIFLLGKESLLLFSTLSILSYISVLGMYLLVWKSMNIILVLFLIPLSTGTFKTLSVIVLHVSFLFLCAGIRGIRKAENPGSLIFQENSSYPEKWAKRAQNALQNRIMDRHARFFFRS